MRSTNAQHPPALAARLGLPAPGLLGLAVAALTVFPACPDEQPPQPDRADEARRADGAAHAEAEAQAEQARQAAKIEAERAKAALDQPLAEVPDPAPPVPALSAGAGIEDERNTIAVFQAVAPATVYVTQSQRVRNRFTLRVDEIPAGTGTGFIWDRQGHVVTNFHVVAGADRVSVTLWDDRVVPARFVGGDPKRDIAVLALQLDPAAAEQLTPVSLPDPDLPLVVGQKALAIGNPFGLDHTLTVGVISALEREVVGFGGVTIRDMIQTDASINPGNSGGPLLDSSGRLIGMNTMIFSKSGASAGIGFAVPVDTIRRLVPQIIQYGQPRRAALGIEVVPDRLAARNNVRGVIIDKVHPRSPADRAGLHGLRREGVDVLIGDVIVGIDDYAIANFDDLFNALEHFEPGDKVAVKVLRAGETFALETVLEVVEGGIE